jgi:hypothetical protein
MILLMKWIDVNDKLPIKGDRVLFALEGGFVGEGYLNSQNKWIRIGSEYDIEKHLGKVVYWCEMPKCKIENNYH